MMDSIMNSAAPHIVNSALPTMKSSGVVGLAGKIVGLGDVEIKVGLPWWAWLALGTTGGIAVGYVFRDKISNLVRK